MDEALRVRDAYVNGLGVEAGAKRVYDEMLEKIGFIVAGTPEALRIIGKEIMPLLS